MTHIPRHLAATLAKRATQYPVVTLTGPRQAGKTSLCREVFPSLPYVNLESPDVLDAARADPQGFLQRYPQGAVIDEVQRMPELLSYIQVLVDAQGARPGRPYVLTGSHQFELMASVTQSLAGRTAILRLYPLSINELRDAGLPTGTDHLLLCGGYPRVHAQRLPPSVVMGDYFETYVERDLRQLVELRRLAQFRTFVRLCAGRVGGLLNLHSLAVDAGISDPTAREWMALLETSYVVYLLQPWFENLGKRLIKAPKLYFYDTGLAAWLMGLREQDQLAVHPLRGNLFENLVVTEFLKHYEHRGERAPLFFYRDATGIEVDLVVEHSGAPGRLGLVEIKAGQTYDGSFSAAFGRAEADLRRPVDRKMVVYGGSDHYLREGVEVAGIGAGR